MQDMHCLRKGACTHALVHTSPSTCIHAVSAQLPLIVTQCFYAHLPLRVSRPAVLPMVLVNRHVMSFFMSCPLHLVQVSPCTLASLAWAEMLHSMYKGPEVIAGC